MRFHNLQLVHVSNTAANALPSSIIVERGPYLQSGTPTSVIVKWRTNTATESVVNFGTELEDYLGVKQVLM